MLSTRTMILAVVVLAFAFAYVHVPPAYSAFLKERAERQEKLRLGEENVQLVLHARPDPEFAKEIASYPGGSRKRCDLLTDKRRALEREQKALEKRMKGRPCDEPPCCSPQPCTSDIEVEGTDEQQFEHHRLTDLVVWLRRAVHNECPQWYNWV